MMQGRTVTQQQKQYWNHLCQTVGCIACYKEGRFNHYCSIHHIDGRTKPQAHWLVLPLCASHYQDNGMAIAVHPTKKQFEQTYGNQYQLMMDCIAVLQRVNIIIPKPILTILDNKKRQITRE